jgi:hypothetical protein
VNLDDALGSACHPYRSISGRQRSLAARRHLAPRRRGGIRRVSLRRETGDALHLHTFGHPHCWAIVRTGTPQKRIQYLSFGAYEDEIDAFRSRLQHENVEVLNSGEHVTDEGLWFHDCDGRLVQVKAAQKSSPDAKSAFSNPSSARRLATLLYPIRPSMRAATPAALQHPQPIHSPRKAVT